MAEHAEADPPAVRPEPVDASVEHPVGSPQEDVGRADNRADGMDRLVAALVEVRRELRAGHDRAAAREKIIDRLHEENERLRAGERQLILHPLLTDLRRLREDLLRQAAGLPGEVTTAQMAGLLKSFAYSVEQTLERGGVQLLRPVAGTAFDPSRHRVAGTVPAPCPELAGAVAEVLADGYTDTVTGRVLAAAPVRVYRAEPAQEATPQEATPQEVMPQPPPQHSAD